MNRCFAVGVVALCSITLIADAADMQPWMLTKGKAIIQEDFSGKLNAEEWNAAKGAWTVEKGVLKGVELAADHHPAAIRREAPMRNMIIQFDFRFDGSPGFSLSMNHVGGHNSRVVFTQTDFMMKKDVDKKDPADFAVILGECAYKFETGTWYTMLVEYNGPDMLARVDDKAFILGEHAYIDQERASIGFPVRGDAVSFDNVKVWEGTVTQEWPARKAKLLKLQASRPPIEYADPKVSWQVAESKVRTRLLKEDSGFVKLVKARAAIEGKLKSTYPKAFRKGAVGADEKKRLMAEDADYKQLTRDLARARKAERDYMHDKDSKLGRLYEKAFPPKTK